jgi:SAM-dependent methyltransferase
MSAVQHPASYRDPAGFLFTQEDILYRAVQPAYAATYEHFKTKGLYDELVQGRQIIPHEEVSRYNAGFNAYKILKPRQLDAWSYPYEWSFSQLKDAALLTLQLALTGLEHGMILKDANAYNIQFLAGKPLLIDSLSFDLYEEGRPWAAFRQFCDHFLNPLLALQALPALSPAILMAYPDGIPLVLIARMLPWKKRLSMNYQLYVYLAAATFKRAGKERALTIPKKKIIQNITQLKDFITGLQLKPARSAWNHYYEKTILSRQYLEHKTGVVRLLLETMKPRRVTDVGCNTGAFSVLAAAIADEVIAMDSDALSVEQLYLEGHANIYPIVADIACPTPALGWANTERKPLAERIGADAVMALAVVHHLALSKNIPLSFISCLFASIAREWLIIEFVPKQDPRAQLLLAGKGDIFPEYNQAAFETIFANDFMIEWVIPMDGSERLLYVMSKRL